MSRAYYNERDPYAAAWLENLIAAGEIAPGDVDTRDILDVMPADLDGYTQCHFFAGIGIWSRALREAGWPDDRPVWTGSCPCQPFSAAGARAAFDDERHLFPGWHWLIEQHRPDVVFGEQVASRDGLVWADLVQATMEATGYACGFVDTCAAGFRSFHIRQRLYFAAGLGDTGGARPQGWVRMQSGVDQRASGATGLAGRMVHTTSARLHRGRAGKAIPEPAEAVRAARSNHAGRMADSTLDGRGEERQDGSRGDEGNSAQGWAARRDASRDTGGLADANGTGSQPGRKATKTAGQGHTADTDGCANRPDTLDGIRRDVDWLFCRDAKWRAVEPGTFPLAHAATARVGRLRAYGNGLDLAQATAFVRAYMEGNVVHRNACVASDDHEVLIP